jgi:hypothetical protein
MGSRHNGFSWRLEIASQPAPWLEAMTLAARETFATAMRERGTDPNAFELLVHIDELVGPMAFVAERDGKKRSWPLPVFQGHISRS